MLLSTHRKMPWKSTQTCRRVQRSGANRTKMLSGHGHVLIVSTHTERKHSELCPESRWIYTRSASRQAIGFHVVHVQQRINRLRESKMKASWSKNVSIAESKKPKGTSKMSRPGVAVVFWKRTLQKKDVGCAKRARTCPSSHVRASRRRKVQPMSTHAVSAARS